MITEELDNKYPQLMIQYKASQVDYKHNVDINYAILSRKRYTRNVEIAKDCLGYKVNGSNNSDKVKTVESTLMTNSFIIHPQRNNKKFEVRQYMNYGFGTIPWMKEDVINVLPHFFICRTKEEYVAKCGLSGFDNQDPYYLRNKSFEQMNNKFMSSIKSSLRYSTKH